jgi:hypothetical protein
MLVGIRAGVEWFSKWWDFFQGAPKKKGQKGQSEVKKSSADEKKTKKVMLGAPVYLWGPVGFFAPRYMANPPLYS